jgi:protein phosphatase
MNAPAENTEVRSAAGETDRRRIVIPTPSLVVLIGASGSGKSTFARTHFLRTEIVSSDFCRGLVSDDENSQTASADAFDLVHYIAGKRLKRGLLIVIDATNVQREGREQLIRLAREHHALPVAIVLNLPERVCRQRNASRPDRDFGPHVIRRQTDLLRRSLRHLQREGFRYVTELDSPETIAAVEIEREPLWVDRRGDHGPFDIVGDIHGCLDETLDLLTTLGYAVAVGAADDGGRRFAVEPPDGRRAIFLGDLTDRGPDAPGVLRLVMDMVDAGMAMCLPGNHDEKLLRKLKGRNVRINHGLDLTLEQLETEPPGFAERVIQFLDGLISHYVLDDGRLVVAHAGLTEPLQGRASKAVRDFALYGDVTGETDDIGLPVRRDWAAEYRGSAMVVYGHSAVADAEWLNNTIDIDTGCVFGGRLTALRYPERELISVPARRVYSEPPRPLQPEPELGPTLSAQHAQDDLLNIEDVLGRRFIETGLTRIVSISEGQALAALETMSRFTVNPKWLIYLPPTMSPVETSREPLLLEHPAEAIAYFREREVLKLVAEEKHMGSRAIIVLCREDSVPQRQFGIVEQSLGIIYTRTGRRFFDERVEQAVLDRLRLAMEASGLWDELGTDWICLDAEIMPWSAKAQELLRRQYAPAGTSARVSLQASIEALEGAKASGIEVDDLLARTKTRLTAATAYVDAYRRYVWRVESVSDLKIAPIHLLASHGGVHTDKDHGWHLAQLARLCAGDPELLLATAHRVIDLADESATAAAIAWWGELTGEGGEGVVVKPWDFVSRGPKGLLQPAIKVRGREYLRIIYGPEYTLPEHIERLRSRGLSAKRSLALREFSLGIEALTRFVNRESLRRVHECVFGVLALESEPVDPRL